MATPMPRAEGFVDALPGNVVSEEEDVRNVLAKVQLGEADAGIVYDSDATASALAGTPLTVIEFPAGVPVSADLPDRRGERRQRRPRQRVHQRYPFPSGAGGAGEVRLRRVTSGASTRVAKRVFSTSSRPACHPKRSRGSRGSNRGRVRERLRRTKRSSDFARDDVVAGVSLANRNRNAFTWALVAISVVGLVLLTLPTVALVIRRSRRATTWTAQARSALREALILSLVTSLISIALVVDWSARRSPTCWPAARIPGHPCVRCPDRPADHPAAGRGRRSPC